MFRFAFMVVIVFPLLGLSQSGSYVASAGYNFAAPTAVAPGQAVTLFVRGLSVPDAVANTVPLPRTLSGVTVVVITPPTPTYPTTLPIFSIRSSTESCAEVAVSLCNTTAITVQFPFEPTCIPSGFPSSCTSFYPEPLVRIAIQTNAGSGEEFWFGVVTQNTHFLNSCDAIFGTGGICYPFATHADGSLNSTSAPARPGEVIVLYAAGLGLTQSGGQTGNAPKAPDPIVGDFYLSWGYFVDVPPSSPAAPRTLVQSGQWIKAGFGGRICRPLPSERATAGFAACRNPWGPRCG
jgi:hypothetical protein